MSRTTTDTRRDKTTRSPPAIVKVNRKRTNGGGRKFHTERYEFRGKISDRACFRDFLLLEIFEEKKFIFLLRILLDLILLSLVPKIISSLFFFSSSLLSSFFSVSLSLSRSFSSNIPAFYCVPRERSLTRAFYVRRARFSAVIDATSVGWNPLESIELIQSADFNLMRTRTRDLVKFKDTTRNG